MQVWLITPEPTRQRVCPTHDAEIISLYLILSLIRHLRLVGRLHDKYRGVLKALFYTFNPTQRSDKTFMKKITFSSLAYVVVVGFLMR